MLGYAGDITGAVILGLLVGSFLNVVIYRLPLMMERDWRKQCAELAVDDGAPAAVPGNESTATSGNTATAADEEDFNLFTPRSRCPGCGTQIKAWQNIPVISWLLLRGKCAACSQPISARYPVIELVTGLLSGLLIWHFGAGLMGAAGLAFLWALIALTVIDFDHQLLPDSITLPLLWLGLLLAVVAAEFSLPHPTLEQSVIGAAAGYLSLWSVYWLFKLATGKEGMGYGDFKLLAAIGAWVGYALLPVVIILSAVVGAVVGITLIVVLGRDRQIPIPFGPYLAGAGLITLIWGRQIAAAYLNYAGL